MKKFLYLFIIFLFSTASSFSADMRFVQIDGALLNLNNEKSINQLEKAVQDINKQKDVEFVIYTGNNIARAKKENLEKFVEINKKLKSPYYVILGNKDVNRQKDFGKNEYLKYLSKKVKTHKKIVSPNYVFVKKNIVFIIVDGSKDVIPLPQGYYREETLDWLEEQLVKYNDKNVVILQHFPIVPPTKKEMYYTYKADEYLELVNNHKNIKAVISGHFNFNNEQKVENIVHISTANLPSYRIIDIVDYDSENPTFWCVIKN